MVAQHQKVQHRQEVQHHQQVHHHQQAKTKKLTFFCAHMVDFCRPGHIFLTIFLSRFSYKHAQVLTHSSWIMAF